MLRCCNDSCCRPGELVLRVQLFHSLSDRMNKRKIASNRGVAPKSRHEGPIARRFEVDPCAVLCHVGCSSSGRETGAEERRRTDDTRGEKGLKIYCYCCCWDQELTNSFDELPVRVRIYRVPTRVFVTILFHQFNRAVFPVKIVLVWTSTIGMLKKKTGKQFYKL